jgi:hypothetical protein
MNFQPPFRNSFHAGYIVRDLAQAVASMRNEFDVEHWKILPLPDGAPARAIGMAYVHGTMIELIEVGPKQEAMAISRGWIPPRPDAVARLNHLAYLLDSEEELVSLVGRFEAAGITTASLDSLGDVFSRSYYADTRAQLGHLTEFVCLGPAGPAFLADVPRN